MTAHASPIAPAPADPLELLRHLIDISPHSVRSASEKAGLGKDTVRRWLEGERHPRVAELDKALALFGYTLRAAPMF